MKPDSPLSKLPSLDELLAHPAVAGVVSRINQTTIAQRATGFLQDLSSGVLQQLEQRGGATIGQLAERFARQLIGTAETATPCVNATGVILGQSWATVPLAEAAVEEMARLASEFHQFDTHLAEQVTAELKEQTGATQVAISPDFASLRNQCVGQGVHIAPFAGLRDPAEFGIGSLPTLAAELENQGVVLTSGAGLLGGPPCGVLLGRAGEETAFSAVATEVPASNFTLAALLTTLRIYRDEQQYMHKIPVWQLLSSPLENLQQRTERLAPLMAEAALVQSATAVRMESCWCDTPELRLTAPSWGIEVVAAEGALGKLTAALAGHVPSVVARTQQNRILLDLRSVFPRWDHALVKAVEKQAE